MICTKKSEVLILKIAKKITLKLSKSYDWFKYINYSRQLHDKCFKYENICDLCGQLKKKLIFSFIIFVTFFTFVISNLLLFALTQSAMKENNFNLLQKILYGNLKKRSSTDNLLKNKKNLKT